MKHRISYKNRCYLLLIGSLLFLLICYKLAFKRTLNEIKSFNENNRQLISLNEAPIQLQILESKLKDTESSFKTYTGNKDNLEVLLLEKATSLIHGSNLKIVELPKNDIYTKDEFTIKTQQIVIQGSYNELLLFLHSFEKDKIIGTIRSVEYYSQREIKTGITSLRMKIYIQTITQDKKE
jgi:Tfp pilus assembly protein PilO